jgi:phosphoribosylformylglycinamidine synthase
MYNDFSGFDAKNNKIKISIPPTLLISSLGIVKSINDLTSICPSIKDLIYVIGETKEELGGSEYANIFGYENINVPSVNSKKALKLYNAFNRANKKSLISSAISVHMGGLGAALAKMAIASQTGMQLDLSKINSFGSSNTLFSESQSRMIVSIKPSNKKVFEKLFTRHIITHVGECTSNKKFLCRLSSKDSIQVTVSDLSRAYKGNIKKL